MANYYLLVAKAVAGLEKNTGESQRILYERARNALMTQLRSVTPPLSEPDITRERLALQEAIRKVEADVARRARAGTAPGRSERPLGMAPAWPGDEALAPKSGSAEMEGQARAEAPPRAPQGPSIFAGVEPHRGPKRLAPPQRSAPLRSPQPQAVEGVATHPPSGDRPSKKSIKRMVETHTRADKNRDMARHHRAGEQVEPHAARLGELLQCRHRHQSVPGARQLRRCAVAPVVAHQAQGQATQGRDLSTLAPLWALRARTPGPAWTRRAVGEGVKFCPREAMGQAAEVVAPSSLDQLMEVPHAARE